MRPGLYSSCGCTLRRSDTNQIVQQFDRSVSRSLLLTDQVLGPAAELSSKCGLSEAAADKGFELVFAVNDDRRIALDHLCHYVAEIPCVRAKRNGCSISGGLNHVLAAAIGQTAADESDICGAPPVTQLADGID